MVDQVIGIGSVSLLVYLGVGLTRALRDIAARPDLIELERGVIRVPELEEEPVPAA